MPDTSAWRSVTYRCDYGFWRQPFVWRYGQICSEREKNNPPISRNRPSLTSSVRFYHVNPLDSANDFESTQGPFTTRESRSIRSIDSVIDYGKTTEDQLVYLGQELENANEEKKKKIFAVFVDLTKAFDKVWKEGLLLKLLRKQVGRQMFSWIDDFQQHRIALVHQDSHISHSIRLQQEFPQGGVISTALFFVFIADGLSRHISRALHADDLAIWNAEENLPTTIYRMQEALNTAAT
ncbi:reverse transcriptase [Elysia marginata]|uniref:Reverse transcriptase n=1 Tax=Elysia marginata TaxID=1093978 RepID=A0AAV4F728_9GAST|nr:reverse transcriptase [Elysia marginata]